ncbi:NADP-dependent oxidoreductase domain-containing protein [Rhodofomes roseus]|uniref:NADP-dependent oxidoreductase domain-containing protein n=1 Tax=Rhodofomes roseus TaxID=34475 RepID=A0ABQ8KPQ5_9APHY|nr:NADP-dependent oxidoreductase domain-containing protein [Rhodofomes roseus]KAH9840558.1 NADP-dependent oxidoreductase domain-containing protein [Rhodofomes roseus]
MPLLGLGVYLNNECFPACVAALKHGYRHIDSARLYHNEAEVGRAVRESGVPRSEVFVTSKIGSGSGEHGYESTLKAVDSSLQRFGFDYLDLYLIHDPLSGKQKRLETWRALLEAKKAGKLRTVGVSNYGVKHLEEIREAGLEAPAVNQIELQPFCQQKEIVEYCSKNNIFIQAYCPLVRGQFGNPVLREVAQKYNKDVAQVLVRWSLQRGFSPLPKSSQPARVVSNADLYDFEISAEDLAKIDALDQGKKGAISWNPVDAD